MTQDDVIRLAYESGWVFDNLTRDQKECVLYFAKLVAEHERKEFAAHAVDIARRAVAEERKACANLCHDEAWKYKVLAVNKQKRDLNNKAIACFDISEKIKARGQA